MVQGNCPVKEFILKYRGVVGGIMADLLLEIVNPLYALHQALKPLELN